MAHSGYISPEYAVDGNFSVKSVVFSFGVLVLEIMSGRRNRGFYHPGHDLNLLGHKDASVKQILHQDGENLLPQTKYLLHQ
ncbi:hypothetical protein LguiA_023202 [Lonicera macranthoides]